MYDGADDPVDKSMVLMLLLVVSWRLMRLRAPGETRRYLVVDLIPFFCESSDKTQMKRLALPSEALGSLMKA
jgi:hypothetical protein